MIDANVDAEAVSDTLAVRAGALFAAFRAGDDAKMGELVALVTPILWHTVRSQNLARSSDEDVLQVSWLALVRNAHSISDPRAVLQWLIVTTRREAWRVSRVENRVQPQDFEADDVVAPAELAPEATVLRAAGGGKLWEHIAQLSERCRQLLRVIAFADRPDYAAVATALGMPVGSIGPTRGRCLAKLRAQLSADPGWEI
jgi:DNA-directed RNA polymerase specialized sigma24 family protein